VPVLASPDHRILNVALEGMHGIVGQHQLERSSLGLGLVRAARKRDVGGLADLESNPNRIQRNDVC